MSPTDAFNHLRNILTAAKEGRLVVQRGGTAEIAHWFGHSLGGGTYSQYEELCALAGTTTANWSDNPKRVSVEPRLSSTERLPPSPRNAAARLCTVMLADIHTRLDADTAPDLLLSDVDIVRTMVIQHALQSEFADELNALYIQCEPVPEPVFSAWHRQYRPNATKPWELVVIHNTHAEAHRSLVKAQAACLGGEYRLVGVVA